MAASCETWRDTSSKRRAEVELISSLPVRLSYTTAHQSLKASWLLPTTCFWGKQLHQLHLPLHGGLPHGRTANYGHSPTPVPSLIGLRDSTLHQILWRAHIWVEPLRRLLQEDSPAPRGERPLPDLKHSSQAMPRHLAETLIW